MLLQQRSARWTLPAAIALIASAPLITGQGCGNVLPIDNLGLPDAVTAGASTGNTPPSFSFTSPTEDISVEVGDNVSISWTASDPDSNASIEILLDPDGDFGNGNERVIVPLILENSGVSTFNLDTGVMGLAAASYRVIARVNDDVNPEVLIVAPGNILLYGAGLLPGNKSPVIKVTEPTQNIGGSQGDTVTIRFCGSDRDDAPNGITPDIVLLLDLDSDPNNDLDLKSATGATTLTNICLGALPKSIPGGIVLACYKDTDCLVTANSTTFTLNVDVGLIPPTTTGDPYRVRATMWDHLNLPVNSYAPGSLTITALASGVVDLFQVGRSVSGSRFQGFDSGAQAGFTSAGIGDLDLDGFDDFVIVERFGTTGSASGTVTSGSGVVGTENGGNVGTAHLVYGAQNKFGGQVSLNSVSVSVRGSFMTMYGSLGPKGGCQWVGDTTVPGLTGTDGLYSVSRVGDVDGDGRPEILFGLPYVKQFFDYADDDPCDCGCPTIDATTGEIKILGCYVDGLPNPLSDSGSCQSVLCGKADFVTGFDNREFSSCSNDLDPLAATSIDGGYGILLNSSENDFENSEISLNLVGQKTDSGDLKFTGARFRGPWYDELDLTQTKTPFSIIPDNRFGETVNSMPEMLDTRTDISPLYGSTLLISAPNGAKGKGIVHVFTGGVRSFGVTVPFHWGRAYGTGNSASFPFYSDASCSCGEGAQFFRPLDYPPYNQIVGADIGDQLGYAAAAGDFNLDGSRDILAGAPGASRVVNGRTVQHGGIVYTIFGRRNFGGADLGSSNPPRMEIRGTNDNDQFGLNQTLIGDVNQDGLTDFAFSTPFADGPGGVDAGFIGIVFGGRQLTGENIFSVSQVGTPQLPGCKIYGAQTNGHAGKSISNVGDFNGDGNDDLLISAPDETTVINGQTRRGLAYLIFGGPHLYNTSLSLSQVGSAQLPGMIFVTPYVVGSADEAPIDSVAAAGDVNGDGFPDILLGVSRADFVNPLEPSQRRIDSGESYLIYGSNAGTNALR